MAAPAQQDLGISLTNIELTIPDELKDLPTEKVTQYAQNLIEELSKSGIPSDREERTRVYLAVHALSEKPLEPTLLTKLDELTKPHFTLPPIHSHQEKTHLPDWLKEQQQHLENALNIANQTLTAKPTKNEILQACAARIEKQVENTSVTPLELGRIILVFDEINALEKYYTIVRQYFITKQLAQWCLNLIATPKSRTELIHNLKNAISLSQSITLECLLPLLQETCTKLLELSNKHDLEIEDETCKQLTKDLQVRLKEIPSSTV
ncbi:MAG: hypothetical protein SP1CHLAM54_00710 [Chlamydiia bacterium]|nr:hypothetical protein [Chlamydiia bacterium]MCH9614993.1 hypothetical protein [Chlamydiia bacterium]MCH9629957.1 hypothetical protein [Chlamydiia bacterium]